MSRFDNDSSSKTLSTKHNEISRDGIDRRGFLQCMAWAGTGLVWTFAGGVPSSQAFGQSMHGLKQWVSIAVQISYTNIEFNNPANTDVTATLQAALDKID